MYNEDQLNFLMSDSLQLTNDNFLREKVEFSKEKLRLKKSINKIISQSFNRKKKVGK